jgi:Ca2+-transporting ATPase
MKSEKSDPKIGLNAAQVKESRSRYGENILTPPKRTPLWKLYLEKYEDPIIRILLVAAAISLLMAFITDEYVETIGIILAIFFATTVGFYFERDAAKKFSVLTAMGEEQPVKVVRDGRVVEIARREVVVGDIVLIETGDEVPADGQLTEATDLQIDESTLTGEPLTTKSATPVSATEEAPQEAEHAYPDNVVLRSTMVMKQRQVVFTTSAVNLMQATFIQRVQATTLSTCSAMLVLLYTFKQLTRLLTML